MAVLRPDLVSDVIVSADEPNSIVYCSNLPNEATKDMLQMLFGQVPGLKEVGLRSSLESPTFPSPLYASQVRQIEGRPDIAFVEFETDAQAGMAISALHGFQLDESHQMAVAYAKK
jgi:U2 small nuclear ribonucleoprotein B''